MPSPATYNEKDMKMRSDVLLADLKTVREAAEILGLTERRIRAFINPICNCVARRRTKKLTGADPECLRCKGSGKTPARLKAVQKGKQYFILLSDILEFEKIDRPFGAPKKS